MDGVGGTEFQYLAMFLILCPIIVGPENVTRPILFGWQLNQILVSIIILM